MNRPRMSRVTVSETVQRGYYLSRGLDGQWLARRGTVTLARRKTLPLAYRALRLAAETVEVRAPGMLELVK